MTTTTTRTTYRSVFAVREFRVLFSALLMFVLGFEFEILGLSVLVYDRTRSPFLSALAFSMGFAPQAIGGALFTSLADRLPPRVVITVSLLIRAVPGLVIGLRSSLPIPVMLALVAAAATVAPVFLGSNSGLLPRVLDGDRYVLGRSLFSITGSSIQVVGLGIGGLVLAALPPHWLLVAAGGSLALAGVVAHARPPQARPGCGERSGPP
jgi:MFS family permease